MVVILLRCLGMIYALASAEHMMMDLSVMGKCFDKAITRSHFLKIYASFIACELRFNVCVPQ